jgi:hypothetical protein
MTDPTPTLTEIAADIRKHAPGALPESLHTGPAGPGFFSESTTGREKLRLLPDDIARHVLGFAMVMDLEDPQRDKTEAVWFVYGPSGKVTNGGEPIHEARGFYDSDHSGDPLLSLYAAWKWARGIE